MSAEVQRTLEDLREESLKELDSFALKTWKDYGVKEINLKEEMQTWYWKTVKHEEGRKTKYVEVLTWKGIGTTLEAHIEKRRQAIVVAPSETLVVQAFRKAKDTILNAALYLWARDWIPGPLSALRLAKDADKADALANYLDRVGKDENADAVRRRAKLLRRKAAGEDVEIPRRASGAIDRVRALYADLEKDGKQHARSEYISVGTAAGIHPGTCAVQYAKWKREKPDVLSSPQQEIRKEVQQRPRAPWEV